MAVHRGRTKEGKIRVQINLTPKEIEQLDLVAEANCRSRTGHALWLVKQGIGKEEPKGPIIPLSCRDCGEPCEGARMQCPQCWELTEQLPWGKRHE